MVFHKFSLFAAIAVVGALIGSLGEWVSLTTVFGTITVNGSSGDGKIMAAIAVVALILLGIRACSEDSVGVGIAGLVAALVLLVFGIGEWRHVGGSLSDAESDYAFATMSWGLPLVVGASVVSIVMEVISLTRASERVEQASPVRAQDWSSNRFGTPYGQTRALDVTPTVGHPGAEITLVATGFLPDERTRIWWESDSGKPFADSSWLTFARGKHSAITRVPESLRPGFYRILVKTDDGRQTFTGFQILPVDELQRQPITATNDPSVGLTLTVYPQAGAPGTELVVKGQGFYFDEEVHLTWVTSEGSQFPSAAKCVATEHGTIGRIAVPMFETPGRRSIEMTGQNGRRASAFFVVTDGAANSTV